LNNKPFKKFQRRFLSDNLEKHRNAPNNFKFLPLCRPTVSIDPVPWLSITFVERSQCIRW
ncbi:MAG: hypothetical protein EXX96DRAFT_485600, partial [Benjaminiella poitrasii]